MKNLFGKMRSYGRSLCIATFYNTKHAISGKRFIITGFGRVAKMLGHILRSIGAEVVIAVRSDVQLNEAKAFRYEVLIFR